MNKNLKFKSFIDLLDSMIVNKTIIHNQHIVILLITDKCCSEMIIRKNKAQYYKYVFHLERKREKKKAE